MLRLALWVIFFIVAPPLALLVFIILFLIARFG